MSNTLSTLASEVLAAIPTDRAGQSRAYDAAGWVAGDDWEAVQAAHRRVQDAAMAHRAALAAAIAGSDAQAVALAIQEALWEATWEALLDGSGTPSLRGEAGLRLRGEAQAIGIPTSQYSEVVEDPSIRYETLGRSAYRSINRPYRVISR